MDRLKKRAGKLKTIVKNPHSLIIIASLLILGLIVWGLYLRYLKGYAWTPRMGFEDKTIWDILDLIIVPLFLAIGAWWITSQEKKREIESQERRIQVDREIAEDRQRENTLRDYLDKMTELLIDKNLPWIEKPEHNPVAEVARARTIIALRSLDKDRQNIMTQFLYDVRINDFILSGAQLKGVNLGNIILFEINLEGANLEGANFENAYLLRVNFKNANIQRANFKNARIENTYLENAHLRSANLENADLSGSDLSGADLHLCNLIGAHLGGVILKDTCFGGANLFKTYITDEQLSFGHIARDVIMPDGSKYDGRFD